MRGWLGRNVPRIYIAPRRFSCGTVHPRLRRPCSSSTSRPACRRRRERGMAETEKSVLGLEETARQLLFLHSSKSSLESNLPVCYCIQTTPQLQRYPSPSTLAPASLLRSLQVRLPSLASSIHTHCERSRVRTLPPRFVPLPRSGTHEFCMYASCLAFR